MMRNRIFAIVLIAVAILGFSFSRQRVDHEKFSIVDLSSPHQNVRDSAAVFLRKLILEKRATDGPGHIREHDSVYWSNYIARSNVRDTLTNVLFDLRLNEKPEEIGMCTGRTCFGNYRFDNSWVVTLYYESNDPLMVFDDSLVYWPRSYFVEPGDTFSGNWTTYFVNGQPSHSIDYVNGIYDGVLKAFHYNGNVCYQQHYVKGVAEGEDRGFYFNGSLRYFGSYHNGKQEGEWIHYHQNGNVELSHTYLKGEIHGTEQCFFENGKLYWENQFDHGKQLRHRAWDKDGNLFFDTASGK